MKIFGVRNDEVRIGGCNDMVSCLASAFLVCSARALSNGSK